MADSTSEPESPGDVRIDVEFFVEPFREGQPGEHVNAAIATFEDRGLPVEVGPFGSTTGGDVARVTAGIAEMVTAAVAAGAERIQLQVTVTR